MKIYNTLTKKIEQFIPNEDGVVKMYTCGPTVYNYAHIGNLRTYIFEDILEKSLKLEGYKVNRVMNITDVGHLVGDADGSEACDKMSKTANEQNKSVMEIADFYTKAFFEDLDKLNIKKPETVSRATDNIDMYIKIIEVLLEKGIAYKSSNGNIYFDITKANDYYKLSGKSPEDLQVAVRDDVQEDTGKKNAFDFGLWFVSSKFENHLLQWDSPWGMGYPGWHIECSGIAIKNLGERLDIHCGAVDNIFPHHTNEIAQSEAYLGHKWCNYWMHGEFLNDLTGKMSKSKGGFLTLQTLIDRGYNPLVYRFFCLNSHYRKQLVFSFDALDKAKTVYNSLKNRINSIFIDSNPVDNSVIKVYTDKFIETIGEDLNTANAITLLYDVLKLDVSSATKLEIIKIYDSVLSLDLISNDVIPQEVIDLANSRKIYKESKNYAAADEIRNKIKDLGYDIKATREGYNIIRLGE